MVPAVHISEAATIEDLNRWFTRPHPVVVSSNADYDFNEVRRLLGEEFANWEHVDFVVVGKFGITFGWQDGDTRTYRWHELLP
jgi:hypothetical protein